MAKHYTATITEDEYRALQTAARVVGLFMKDESISQVDDPWEPELRKWLDAYPGNAVKIKEILGNDYTPKLASRVAGLLVKLGWTRRMHRGGAWWHRNEPIDLVARAKARQGEPNSH
jgi:hypothetical protein